MVAKAWLTPLFRDAFRLLWIAFRRYVANQGSLRAGGLTYLTLMSIVPGMTVVLVLAGAFGMRDTLRAKLEEWMAEAPPKLIEVKNAVMNVVDRVELEVVGALGLLVFVWVVISLLTKVEAALNVTWMAERGRTLARRYADYVAILFLAPLLALVGNALPWLGGFFEIGLDILPFLAIWMAAILLYKIMPNVRVRWGPAAIAGFVTSAAWWSAQGLFMRVQLSLSKANAIYGSLALLPVLLLYLYLSWTIVLWGAELCYAIQNRDRVMLRQEQRAWSPARRRHLGLALMREAVRCFAAGKSLSISEFAGTSGWPRVRVDEIAGVLVEAGLLHRVKLGQSVVPSLPPGEIPMDRVFAAIDGEDDLTAGDRLAPEDRAILDDLRARVTRVEGTI